MTFWSDCPPPPPPRAAATPATEGGSTGQNAAVDLSELAAISVGQQAMKIAGSGGSRGLMRTLGAFSHSASYYVVYPGNTPGTPSPPPLQKHARSIQNRIGGAEFRTLGPVATGGGKQPTFGTCHFGCFSP